MFALAPFRRQIALFRRQITLFRRQIAAFGLQGNGEWLTAAKPAICPDNMNEDSIASFFAGLIQRNQGSLLATGCLGGGHGTADFTSADLVFADKCSNLIDLKLRKTAPDQKIRLDPVLLEIKDAGKRGMISPQQLQQNHRLQTPADVFIGCGQHPTAQKQDIHGQFSFEERMACGFGVCMGCSCKTKYGSKRICKDGPVLRREEILW